MARAKPGKLATSKRAMVDFVAKKMGLPKADVKAILECVAEYVVSELCAGREVYLASLGKFWMRRLGQLRVYLPRKKAYKIVGERSVPKFAYARVIDAFIRKEHKKKSKGA